MFTKGTRIQVVGVMRDDPAPIEVGTTGTVRSVWNQGSQFEQVNVDWDPEPTSGNRRNIMLVPSDYRIVKELPSV